MLSLLITSVSVLGDLKQTQADYFQIHISPECEAHLFNCPLDIWIWMSNRHFKLNRQKTEIPLSHAWQIRSSPSLFISLSRNKTLTLTYKVLHDLVLWDSTDIMLYYSHFIHCTPANCPSCWLQKYGREIISSWPPGPGLTLTRRHQGYYRLSWRQQLGLSIIVTGLMFTARPGCFPDDFSGTIQRARNVVNTQ